MIFSSSGADCQRGLMVGKNYNPPTLAGSFIEPFLELNPPGMFLTVYIIYIYTRDYTRSPVFTMGWVGVG